MNGVKTRLVIPALALLGLGDALYLAVLHLQGEVPPCGSYGGCAQVNTSPYAEIFGIPVAAFGALLYVVVLGVGWGRLWTRGTVYARATLFLYSLTLSGAIFMAYLTGVEAMVLHAFCYWCLGLAAITFVLLALVGSELWAFDSQIVPARAGRL